MGNVLDLAEVVVQDVDCAPASRTALAAGRPTSLVKTGKGNAHKEGYGSTHCENPWYAYNRCGHRNFRWTRFPCSKWACDGCSKRRLADELVPEVRQALLWARGTGNTLKFLTPTYSSSDPGGLPTPEGATRRRWDFQHLAQYVRRDRNDVFEYLRVAESHKTGRIHLHVLAIMPFIHQKELSEKWQDFGGGSFRIDVRAAGMKCPRCYPDKNAPGPEKRRSIIIPPPGRGECLNCGFTPDWSSESAWVDVANAIAFEIGKYLTKEARIGGVKKKLTRSSAWAAKCQVRESKEVERKECDECGTFHDFYLDGQEVDILARTGSGESIVWSVDMDIAWYIDKPGYGPCDCFGDEVEWRAFGQWEPPPSAALEDRSLVSQLDLETDAFRRDLH